MKTTRTVACAAILLLTAGAGGTGLAHEHHGSSSSYPCTAADEVRSAGGRCWKAFNLGAAKIAASPTDAEAYGDLYQWGRQGDGHQSRTSATVDTLSAGDVPGHASFILVNGTNYDWRTPANDFLWRGLGAVNNPCPQGFRLPTQKEFEKEMKSWDSKDAEGAFASPLKLTLAGARSQSDGSIILTDSNGLYWIGANKPGIPAWGTLCLGIGSSTAKIADAARATGMSVRCIKD